MTMTTVITEPCVVRDMPERDYHADPVVGGSFSNSMAKDILPPSCPALFRWKRDNPEPPTPQMELGSAVHTLVLGVGAPIVEVTYDSWRPAVAKTMGDRIREAGSIPLLTKDLDRAVAMADALTSDPVARVFLDTEGDPEVSAFWRDEPTGIMRRARMDKVTRPVLCDVKTTSGPGDPHAFGRDAAAKYGYMTQAATYLEGARTLGLVDDDAGFVFLVVSSAPPHLVSVVELDVEYLEIGRRLNRRAVDTYARCLESDEWPSYARDVTLVGPPAWLRFEAMENTA